MVAFNKKAVMHIQQGRTEASACPSCGTKLDAWTTADKKLGVTPATDDLTVCGGCGAINQFNEDLSVRTVDAGVVDALSAKMKRKLEMFSEIVKNKLKADKPKH
jgi:transcription elongation factor Elf1